MNENGDAGAAAAHAAAPASQSPAPAYAEALTLVSGRCLYSGPCAAWRVEPRAIPRATDLLPQTEPSAAAPRASPSQTQL